MSEKPIPFLDLKAQYHSIAEEVEKAVLHVLRSTHYILGPEVSAFEEAFAKAHEIEHCVGTNNGTSALHLALWALGIGRGDEVLVPVNTFIATAEAVLLCGAEPVFVDHDEFYNLDPEACVNAITPRTKAIIAVHLYGQPSRMNELRTFANERNLLLIEDAAQAHLARFDGKSIGAWGDATCFSFYPGKNLGAYGEAGAVITRDAELTKVMRELRDHGSQQKYHHPRWGQNYRMEAVQGAVLKTKLPYLAGWTASRQRNAAFYSDYLSDISQIKLPCVHQLAEPVWHLYVVQAERRDELKAYLEERGIATGLHYPIALDKQSAFANTKASQGSFPRSDASVGNLLSLPMYPELEEIQIERVADVIRAFYQ